MKKLLVFFGFILITIILELVYLNMHIVKRINDIERIYTTIFETDAIRLLNKYGVDYIWLSNRTKKEFAIAEISYTKDENCFELVYQEDIEIYKTKCKIEEVQ